MKQRFAITLCLFLLLVSGAALAERDHFSDPIPGAVLALDKQYDADGDYLDCILFADTPLGAYCLVLTPWRLYGYIQTDGEWTNWAQLSSIAYETGTQTYFRRHAAGAAPGIQGAGGLRYPDDRGFDLIKAYSGDPNGVATMLQFHWMEDDFRLVGWQAGAAGQFAILQDGLWVYFNSFTGERLGSVRLDRLTEFGLLARAEDLPYTLDDAREMEAVTQAAAEALFPGWTLSSYEEYNFGHMASAGYYRIEGGMLFIRRVTLKSDANGVARQADTMPVPLSGELLLRLEAGDAETLIDTSGDGDTFLTDAAFDRRLIPVTGTVLQNDLQENGMLLLVDEINGARVLQWAEKRGDVYVLYGSRPLPQDTGLDLFHFGDDEALLEWDGQDGQCYAVRTQAGVWEPRRVIRYGDLDSRVDLLYCGVRSENAEDGTVTLYVGTHPWRDLFTTDLAALPDSTRAAVAGLSREGWAVVSNPDPADRLHLRAGPDKQAQSLGKFYNGTPVQVLERKDGWARVRVGTDGRLEGWMMETYLAFGSDMDAVASAFPQLIPRDGYENSPLFSSPDQGKTTGVPFGYGTWIVGVIGDEWFILLDEDGSTGYLPQSWLYAGNG